MVEKSFCPAVLVRMSDDVKPLSINELPTAIKIESIAIKPNSAGLNKRANMTVTNRFMNLTPNCCPIDHIMPDRALYVKLMTLQSNRFYRLW